MRRRRPARWGETDKLHVPQYGPGPVRQGVALPQRNGGIGGVAIELTQSARGKDYGAGGKLQGASAGSRGHGTGAFPVAHQELGNPDAFAHGDPVVGAHPYAQRIDEGAAGGIAPCMDDAPPRMGPLPPEKEVALGIDVKGHTQLRQQAHHPRPARDQRLYRLRVAQSLPGAQRVGGMERGTVVLGKRRRQAPLGEPAVADSQAPLCHQHHPSMTGGQ